MMIESKEKYKIIVMAILLGICCTLTYYFHAILGTGTVFTHFFYIPIILASLWWKRKGLVVAIFLAVFLICSHIFLSLDVEATNDYFRAIAFIGVGFTVATLSEMVAKAQAKTTHLNLILRSIRSVNLLIAMEKDRDRLLKGACERLIETRGYHNAWIALLDGAGMLVAASEAGLGGDFLPMIERLKRGELPYCGQRALSEPGIVVTQVQLSTCADCPLAEKYGGMWAMTTRLEHGGKLCGLLCVSIPRELTANEEERALFNEVASDFAFALHGIELEEARKQAEEEIRKLNKELESKVEERTKELVKERDYTRHLIESSPDFQMTLDKEGRIMDVNKAFEEIVGKSREDLIGESIYVYLPKKETEKAIVEILEKKKVRNIELTADIPERGDLICNFSGTVFTTPEGEIGIYATGRDITELRAKDVQLIHAGRLSSLGQMATGVAHEINQPLSIISMAAEGTLRDIKENRFNVDALPRDLEATMRNVNRIDVIITHMRTFARKPEEWKRVEPEEVLSNVFILLGEQFKMHGVLVSRKIDENLPAITVDTNQLEQVFVNILINARHVLDERGDGDKKEGENFEKRLVCGISREKIEEKDCVVYEFADNAYGVPEELKMSVFEPFFTTKEPGDGTGLGLSIAYSIVTRSLNGKIWVENNDMGGASFKVALPVGG